MPLVGPESLLTRCDIYVVPNLFISKNDFTKVATEVIASIYFSEFIH